jgi:hypothetical protein
LNLSTLADQEYNAGTNNYYNLSTVDPEGRPVSIVFEESKPWFINSAGDKFTINPPSSIGSATYYIVFSLTDGTVKSA